MLTHSTLDQLKALKLDGMVDAFVELQNQQEVADLTRAEWLALLLDRELATRSTKLRPSQAVMEGVDYRAPRQLDKALYQQLAGYLVRSPRKRGAMAIPCSMPASPGWSLTWNSRDLSALDDWGPDQLTANQRRDLLEIVEDRYGRGSTLITSQHTLDKWHDAIGQPTFADAILDRIVHNAYRLELNGTSMRKLKAAVQIEAEVQHASGPLKRNRSGRHPTSTRSLMTIEPSPVGQQGPPKRAAAPAKGARRIARGPLYCRRSGSCPQRPDA